MIAAETLPEGWFKVESADARKFEAELKREACSLHPLFGLKSQCIARRDDRDDFLFFCPEHSHTIAVVHLTWSKEKTADFPWTTFFEDGDDFIANWGRIFE